MAAVGVWTYVDFFQHHFDAFPFEAHQILGSWPVDFSVLRREAQSTFAQGLHQAKDPASSSSMGNFEATHYLVRVSHHNSHQLTNVNEGLGWPCSSATRDDERTATERTQLYIKFWTRPRHNGMLLCKWDLIFSIIQHQFERSLRNAHRKLPRLVCTGIGPLIDSNSLFTSQDLRDRWARRSDKHLLSRSRRFHPRCV